MRTHDEQHELWLLDALRDGRLTLRQFLRQLAATATPAGVSADNGSSRVRGTVDTLRAARDAGLIDEDGWAVVLRRAELAPNLVATVDFSPVGPDDDAPCRCVRLPDAAGRSLPQAYVAAHDEVRVVSRNGRVVEGWTDGLGVISTPDGRELALIVEPTSGHPVGFAHVELATVTPVDGITERGPFVDQLLSTLDDAIAGSVDDATLRLILGAHTLLEVTVERKDVPCQPTPEWKSA